MIIPINAAATSERELTEDELSLVSGGADNTTTLTMLFQTASTLPRARYDAAQAALASAR
jgi:bacteriocin-like protein